MRNDNGLQQGGLGQAGAQNQPAENPSCFGDLRLTTDNAARTYEHVRQIVDRLVGSAGENANKAAPTPVPNGLFDEAARNVADINNYLISINDALDRLGRSLP